ncbi:MAG TPA: HAMP domain-containing sensor histidine kinase [Acidimicrobiales bacterium]|nr:HAMP domain-containing sensor histidine kinase [Acidimicrobiales bacterium]
MTRRLVLSYVTVAAVILLALELPLGLVYARHEHDVASVGVVHDATALASLADDGVEHRSAVDLGALAGHYRSALTGDVAIMDRTGALVVTPRPGDGELASPAIRTELLAVTNGAPGGTRVLPGVDDLIAFEPVGSAEKPSGAVVVAASDERVDQRVHEAWLLLVVMAGGVLAGVALLGLVAARSVTGPLTQLSGAARRLGSGDLEARAPVSRGPREVRDLSVEFNSMAGRLEELVAAQRGFVADASHQLRSPLTALRLRLENISATLPDAGGDVDAVVAELDRLSRVVDGLLMLARAEGQRPVRASVDVTAVVADRTEAWSALADEAGVALAADPLPALPVGASLVPGHLEQILDNLLANALEATPAGRSVHVGVHADGGTVEVHVTDEGQGMRAEERRRAFDRFWRGAASQNGSGSGLGLSIVHQLARTSGADVELREAAGGGVDAVVRMAAVPERARDLELQ